MPTLVLHLYSMTNYARRPLLEKRGVPLGKPRMKRKIVSKKPFFFQESCIVTEMKVFMTLEKWWFNTNFSFMVLFVNRKIRIFCFLWNFHRKMNSSLKIKTCPVKKKLISYSCLHCNKLIVSNWIGIGRFDYSIDKFTQFWFQHEYNKSAFFQ